MATIVNARDVILQGAGTRVASVTLPPNVIYAGDVTANQITSGTIYAASLSTTGYGAFYGQIPSAITIAGQSQKPTVLGASPNGDIGVAGTSTDGYGVLGDSDTGTGVRGNSDSWYGVWGSSTTGQAVRGVGNSSSATGVHGRAVGGIGVEGFASGATGIGVRAECALGTALQVVGKMTITSNVMVSNLNADLLDGKHAADFAAASHTHSGYAASSHTHSTYPAQFVTDSGTGNISNGTVYFYTSTGLTAYQFFSDGGGSVGMRAVSDASLKQDVEPETLGLDFLMQLNPVRYRMKADPSVQLHGFLAQDVEPLISGVDALKMRYPDGVRGMDYLALIAPIVKAIQQINDRLTALESSNA